MNLPPHLLALLAGTTLVAAGLVAVYGGQEGTSVHAMATEPSAQPQALPIFTHAPAPAPVIPEASTAPVAPIAPVAPTPRHSKQSVLRKFQPAQVIPEAANPPVPTPPEPPPQLEYDGCPACGMG